MKFVLACACALAAALAGAGGASASVFRLPTVKPPLQDRLEKIISFIPISKIQAIVQSYVDKGDSEVIEIYNYAHSGQLQSLVGRIYTNPKVQEQIHDLETKGVRISEILKAAQDYINHNKDVIKDIEIKKADGVQKVSKQETHGVAGLMKDILVVVPVEKILPELLKLYMLNEEVQIIYEHLRKKECYEIAQEVLGWEDVRADLARLQAWGVDIDGIIIGIEQLLGWPSNEIHRV